MVNEHSPAVAAPNFGDLVRVEFGCEGDPKINIIELAAHRAQYELGVACYNKGTKELDSRGFEAVKFAQGLISNVAFGGAAGANAGQQEAFNAYADSVSLASNKQHSPIA